MIQLQSQSCAFLCSTSTSVNGYILSEFNLKKFKYKLGSRDDEDMGFMRLQQRCLADWNGDMECRSKKKNETKLQKGTSRHIKFHTQATNMGSGRTLRWSKYLWNTL